MSNASFTALMSLEPSGDDRFMAPIAPERSGRMFGGQFLAQGLMAARATVKDRDAHSLHAYFLRPGAVDAPTEFSVERVRDGRSFSSRCVTAWQNGKELFRMMVSYHVPEPGNDYAGAVMPKVPPPESVKFTYAEFHREMSGNDEYVDQRESKRPWDIRYIDAPTGPLGEPVTDDQRMWMRLDEAISEEPGLQQAALAYLSDATFVDHIVLPHGLRWGSPDVDGTSLDHAMWFYRGARADEWLLFDQHVESTGNARGLVSGRFFTQSGELIATCCQEGLMRLGVSLESDENFDLNSTRQD